MLINGLTPNSKKKFYQTKVKIDNFLYKVLFTGKELLPSRIMTILPSVSKIRYIAYSYSQKFSVYASIYS